MSEQLIFNPELLNFTRADVNALLPHLWVLIGIVFAVLLSAFKAPWMKWAVLGVTTLFSFLALLSSIGGLSMEPHVVFNQMMVADSYGAFFNLIFLGSVIITCFASVRYLDREDLQFGEYYALLLLSAFGMMVMVSARDLVVLFVALEIMSLSVYSLVGFRRADRLSNEASMKYFILGGAASAIMLYGVALLYGATSSTNMKDILGVIQTHSGGLSSLFVLGAWLVIVGFLFKVASVPFHMWMPDVYEGAPAPVTGFMTTALKAAAFGAFLRVFKSLGYDSGLVQIVGTHGREVLWVCAAMTMLIGNVIALTQSNLKRLLAYSSIAHTGYLLVGFLAAGPTGSGYSSVVVYLMTYAVMNLGAFGVLSMIAKKGDTGLTLYDLSGLSKRHPWMAFAMAVFLFSMAGIPPTAGFVAKYLLFYSAVQAGETLLVVIAVLCSAISVYYYLRVLVFMYMKDPVEAETRTRQSFLAVASVAAMVWMTLQVGLLPSSLVDLAKRIVTSL